jgi:hypothetical protein
MDLLQEMNFNEVVVQKLSDEYLRDQCIELSVLRLDRIHPVVSGNKWFKLKYYCRRRLKKIILPSEHLVVLSLIIYWRLLMPAINKTCSAPGYKR